MANLDLASGVALVSGADINHQIVEVRCLAGVAATSEMGRRPTDDTRKLIRAYLDALPCHGADIDTTAFADVQETILVNLTHEQRHFIHMGGNNDSKRRGASAMLTRHKRAQMVYPHLVNVTMNRVARSSPRTTPSCPGAPGASVRRRSRPCVSLFMPRAPRNWVADKPASRRSRHRRGPPGHSTSGPGAAHP